jgi:hypothetical protein
MLSDPVAAAPARADSSGLKSRTGAGDVIAFFICSGVRNTPAGFTLFPSGGIFEETEVCPARDICAWHAAHDLGGEVAVNDQPESRLLPVQFRAAPFACPRFKDHEELLRSRQAAAKRTARGSRPVPASAWSVVAQNAVGHCASAGEMTP